MSRSRAPDVAGGQPPAITPATRSSDAGWLTIPNVLTILRIVSLPFFGYLWWRRRFAAALIIFVAAAVSDVLDGFLARALNQRSKLGQLLDPAADKLMVLVTLLSAAATGTVPRWLAALVLTRDLLLAAASGLFAFVFRGVLDPDRWRPTLIGKYTTLFTLLTIGTALTFNLTEYEPLRPFIGALAIMSGVTTVVSGMQYLARGVRAFGSAKLPVGGDKE